MGFDARLERFLELKKGIRDQSVCVSVCERAQEYAQTEVRDAQEDPVKETVGARRLNQDYVTERDTCRVCVSMCSWQKPGKC